MDSARQLVDRHGPEVVVAALRPILSDERIARIEAVLDARLAGLTIVVENLYDPHNGAAAVRSAEAFGLSAVHAIEGTGPFHASPAVTIGCEKWIDLHRHPDVASARAEAVAACTHRVEIPMYGFTRSFNLSVSAALILARASERRRTALGRLGDLPAEERAHRRARWYAQDIRGAAEIIERYVSK